MTEKTEELQPKSAFQEEGVVQSASEMELDPLTFKWKAFLAGPSGSGKSTVAAKTLPGRKLLIECDGRKEALVGISDLDVFSCLEPNPRSPVAWNLLERVRRIIIGELRKGIFLYDSLIFDGLTMMGRFSLNWALLLDSKRGLGGSPARQHYGPQMDNLAKFVLSTLALPLHVAYTGHIELLEDTERGTQRFYPKITGKLRTEVSNWFNETYYCYRQRDDEEDKLRYYWLTAGSGRQEFFKSSLNTLGEYWKDPIELDFSKEGPTGFQDLLERRFIKGKMKREVESAEKVKGDKGSSL